MYLFMLIYKVKLTTNIYIVSAISEHVSFYHSYCAADDNEDTGHTSHLVVFTGQSWFVFDLVLCV